MMGHDAHDPSLRGLIPRISEALFEATTTPVRVLFCSILVSRPPVSS